MDEDWAIDVRKYAPGAEPGVIAGIVRHCGIALRNRDSSLVSFSDPAETDRVRESFLKKKLGLTDSNASLDSAIAAVGDRMREDRTKNRVTVYYLLAEHFGKLGLFGGSAAAAVTGAGAGAATLAAAGAAVGAAALMGAGAPPVMTASSAVPPVAGAAAPATQVEVPSRGISGRGDARPVRGATAWWLPLAVLAIAGILLFLLVPRTPHVVAPAVAVAPVEAPLSAVAPTIPAGSGLVTQQVAGKPLVSVYFDTAKTDVSPEIAPAAAELKSYLAANAGSKLSVSGYNDPTGNAAFNAELSKKRAVAVRDALVAAGISADAIELVKPEATTDVTTTAENARRVDVKII